MNRGSADLLWIEKLAPHGFNEAPIHESGKFVRSSYDSSENAPLQ